MLSLNSRSIYFSGGTKGAWKVLETKYIQGQALPTVDFIDITHSSPLPAQDCLWTLQGVSSNARYTTRQEKTRLDLNQSPLGRAEASCAALIPIKKSDEWWNLSQDERRRIFETDSKHIENSMKYLPAISRKLYHCRDLFEPFDFLTWFEFSPEHIEDFNQLVFELRASVEWKYVTREIDLRLIKSD